MSRVFTIHFPFKGKNYTALVSFKSQSYDPTYLVKYLDEEVEMLIPGNKLQVSRLGGIDHPEHLNEIAKDLVCKTTEAVDGYLSTH